VLVIVCEVVGFCVLVLVGKKFGVAVMWVLWYNGQKSCELGVRGRGGVGGTGFVLGVVVLMCVWYVGVGCFLTAHASA
jgi:hypothetical protein